MLQTTRPTKPDQVVLVGTDPCPKGTPRRFWKSPEPCKFVIDHALGKGKLAAFVIVRCRKCGVRLRIECLNSPTNC